MVCTRCKRRLRDPESVARGLGRLCAKREGILADRRLTLGASVFPRSTQAIPGQTSLFVEVDVVAPEPESAVDRAVQRAKEKVKLETVCRCGERVRIGDGLVRAIISAAERGTKTV